MKNSVIAAVAALAATVALADTDYSTYVQLVTSDTGSNDSSCMYGGHWSDKARPSSGKKYYVPSGLTLHTPADNKNDRSFDGDVLACAGTVNVNLSGSRTYSWPEIRLLNGALYTFGSVCHVGGKIVMASDETSPACFQMFYPNSLVNVNISAALEGPEGSVLKVCRDPNGARQRAFPDAYINLTGDLSGFYGKVIAAFEADVVPARSLVSIPCTFKIEKGGRVEFREEMTSLGGLELTDGSTVTIPRKTGTLEIGVLGLEDGAQLKMLADSSGSTCPLVIGRKIVSGTAELKLTVDSGFAYGTTAPKFEVLRLPADVAAASDFSRMYATLEDATAPAAKAFARLVTEEDAQGVSHVYVTYPIGDFVMNKENGTGSGSAFDADATAYWQNGTIPSADSSGVALVTEALSTLEEKSYEYPNLEFNVQGGKAVYLHGKYWSCKNFVLGPGAGVYCYRNRDNYLQGKTTILPGAKPVTFKAWEYKGLFLEGTLCGAGDIVVSRNATRPGTYRISWNATAFTGGVTLGDGVSGDTVYVNGSCLGGAASGPNAWKAVRLLNNVTLSCTADLLLCDPTRGVSVETSASIINQGGKVRNLTIAGPVTYNGSLTVNTTGAVTLGGPARFADGQPATAPTSGQNRLVVGSGTLRIANSQALNGVQTELADGVAILLDPTPEDEELRTLGIVNTRWATPFVSAAAGGKVCVRILPDGIFATAYEPFEVGVCTVPFAVAETLKLDIDTSAVTHGKAELKSRTNENGSVTFYLAFYRAGLSIIIR